MKINLSRILELNLKFCLELSYPYRIQLFVSVTQKRMHINADHVV